MKKTLLTLAILTCGAIGANAATITYVFHTGSAAGAAGTSFAGSTTDSHTQSGLTLSATASGPGVGTVFNATGSSFGINAGDSGDDTDQFDTGAGGAEIMTFSFDQAGTFTSVNFASLTENVEVEAVLSFAGGGSYNINNSNTDGSDLFLVNEAFTASQIITLSTSADNHNFALQEMTVDVVPEPASFVLLGLATIGLLVRRRR